MRDINASRRHRGYRPESIERLQLESIRLMDGAAAALATHAADSVWKLAPASTAPAPLPLPSPPASIVLVATLEDEDPPITGDPANTEEFLAPYMPEIELGLQMPDGLQEFEYVEAMTENEKQTIVDKINAKRASMNEKFDAQLARTNKALTAVQNLKLFCNAAKEDLDPNDPADAANIANINTTIGVLSGHESSLKNHKTFLETERANYNKFFDELIRDILKVTYQEESGQIYTYYFSEGRLYA